MSLSVTINDIVRIFGDAYLAKYPKSSVHERKVMRSIEVCRTEVLGGRIEECDMCSHEVLLYNSCRNRHCPLCQFMKKESWILERKKEVLPFTYFHVVFTLPHKLNPIVIRNKRVMYDLLFKICKETLLSVANDKKYFGAQTGFFAILHTWGQKINLHPHLHCVVPGGGFCEESNKWIQASQKFLLPKDVLKPRFRSLFLKGLKALNKSGRLNLRGTLFVEKKTFQRLVDSLFADEWVVYIKESFQGKESVIEYLARYTHRIAISNHRIVSLKGDVVSFKYRDYKDGNREKIMEMKAVEFIRRFMIHVVPPRFVRIRYFGILSHRNKRKTIQSCREFHGIEKEIVETQKSWSDIYFLTTGRKVSACPVCEKGTLVPKGFIPSNTYRAPPSCAC